MRKTSSIDSKDKYDRWLVCNSWRGHHSLKSCVRSAWHARSGLFIQDLFVALILVSVMIACLVPMFSFVARSRRLAYQEQLACQLVANWLDEVLAASESDRETLHRLFEQRQPIDQLATIFSGPDVDLSASLRERFLASANQAELWPRAALQISRKELIRNGDDRSDGQPDEQQLERPLLESWQVAIDWQITADAGKTQQRHAPLSLTGWTLASSGASASSSLPAKPLLQNNQQTPDEERAP